MERSGTAGRRAGADSVVLAGVFALSFVALVVLLLPGDEAPGDPERIVRSGGAPEGVLDRGRGVVAEPAGAGRAVPRGAAAVEAPSGGGPAAPAPERLVDLYVEAVDGRPWFGGADADVPIDVAYWLVVGLAPAATSEGDAVDSADPIGSGPGRRIVREASWRCAFPAPLAPRAVVMLLGDVAVAAAPVAPDAERVVLVVDPAVIARSTSSVSGELEGTGKSPVQLRLDPLVPPSGRGRALEPDLDGARFRFERVPPGRYRLTATIDPIVLWDEVRRTAPGGDGGAYVPALRRRLGSAAELDHCAAALASLAPTAFAREFELAPGVEVDLGVLAEEPTAAVLLRLEVDGGAVEARSAAVGALPTGGPPRAPVDVRWSFADRLLAHPLPTGSSELWVTLGAHAALVPVSLPALGPGVVPFEVVVPLRAIATLLLPPDAVVRSARGGLVYGGGGGALNVPAGSYTVESRGRRRSVDLEPGATRDLTGDARR